MHLYTFCTHLARRSPAQGQSLVEFALILPLLILILLGVLDLGRAFSASVAITNAAREGARYGAGHLKQGDGTVNSTGIKDRTIQEASLAGVTIDPTSIDISCLAFADNSSTDCTAAHNGDRIQVKVTYNYAFLALYLFRLDHISLSNQVVMAITSGL